MKKRIFSAALALMFVFLALPMSGVFAASKNAFEEIDKLGAVHTADGLTYSGTTQTRWLKWNGSMDEGRFSADISTTALATTVVGGDHKPEEIGFLIGASGIATKEKDGLFVFISSGSDGKNTVRTGYYFDDKWDTNGDAVDKEKKTQVIETVYGETEWAAAKKKDTFNFAIDFSLLGVVKIYINDVLILTYNSSYGKETFSGSEIGLRTGARGYSVTLSNIKADQRVWQELDKVNATHSNGSVSYTGMTGTKWFKWKGGEITEGKISADFSASVLDTKLSLDNKYQSEEAGFLVGASGLDNNTHNGLVIFFSCNDQTGENTIRSGFWSGKVWKSGRKTTKLGDIFTADDISAIKKAGKITLSVEFSEKGAYKVWLNGVLAIDDTVPADKISEYKLFEGGQVAMRTGKYGFSVTVSNFEANERVWKEISKSAEHDYSTGDFTYSGLTQNGWFLWNGKLTSGRISADISTAALETAVSDDKHKAEEIGFLIGASGVDTNKKDGLFVFISCGQNGKHTVRTGYYFNNAWDSNGGDIDKEKTTQIIETVYGAEAWASAKQADTFNFAIEYTKDGIVKVFINNILITTYTSSYGEETFSGDQIAIRTGTLGKTVTVSNFKAGSIVDTGDNTAVYATLAAIVLPLAATAVIISKKKRTVV